MPRRFTKVEVKSLDTFQAPLAKPLTSPGRILSPAGELTQLVNGTDVRFIAYVEFAESGISRGNHYHENKAETLYLISGSLEARYFDIDTGEAISLVLNQGDLVRMNARCAHRYTALSHVHAVEFSDTDYEAARTVAFDVPD